MGYKVEETLMAGSLPGDLLPHLLYREVQEGTAKRITFLEGAEITYELRGAVGTKISVPYVSATFTGTAISESNLNTSAYTPTDLTILDTDVTIGNQVYVAWRLSDILLEDQPKYNWFRISFRKAGQAIEEYRDSAVRDVLLAGAGNSRAAATFGTLDDADITRLVAQHKVDSWYPEDYPYASAPLLYLHADQEADLILDTTFIDTMRFAVGDITKLQNPAQALYKGLRPRVSDNMTDALALIVFPPHPKWGTTFLHAIKRPLTLKTEREELYGRQLWVASMRYGQSVLQANAIGLISAC